MKKQFFSEPAPKGWRDRDKQTEIQVDYRLCYECMGAGHDEDRQYLAKKYGVTIKSIGDLQVLGYDLFNRLTPKQIAADRLDAESGLLEAADEQRLCKVCGYQWTPKVKHPKQCPNCKRMDWDKPRIKTNQKGVER